MVAGSIPVRRSWTSLWEVFFCTILKGDASPSLQPPCPRNIPVVIPAKAGIFSARPSRLPLPPLRALKRRPATPRLLIPMSPWRSEATIGSRTASSVILSGVRSTKSKDLGPMSSRSCTGITVTFPLFIIMFASSGISLARTFTSFECSVPTVRATLR